MSVSSFSLLLILSVLLERAQLVATAANYGAQWNGYGAMGGVWSKSSQAPMVYRVLVPWVVRGLGAVRMSTINAYEVVKVLLMWGALVSVYLAWGMPVTLLTAALIPCTFLFDYWDWQAEMIGINLALTGNIYLAIIGAVIFALSRETAPIVSPAYFVKSFDPVGAMILVIVSCLVLLLVRKVQGKHPLYCNRVMIKDNLSALKMWKSRQPAFLSGIVISCVITALAIPASVLAGVSGIIPLAILGAGWTLAKADETRVFVSVLPWIAAALLR